MTRISACLLALLLFTGLAIAQEGASVATGLNGPMGITFDPDGNLWIVDSGVGGAETIDYTPPGAPEPQPLPFGMSARVIRVSPAGEQADVATLPSVSLGMEVSGGNRLVWLDGALYLTSGVWMEGSDSSPPEFISEVVRIDPASGEVTTVADTWAFEEAENPDDFIVESHPYGIAAGPDGMLYVADAGANTLLRVAPDSGEIELVTVFDGVEGMIPNDARGGAQENDPVPTGITFSADDRMLVTFLPGFPPVPGSSRLVAIAEDGSYETVATGMTVTTDVATAPDGTLYTVQMAEFGETGPAPASGTVYRIGDDGTPSPVITGLSFPTALAFDADGALYVTINGVGAPGSGEVLRFEDVGSL